MMARPAAERRTIKVLATTEATVAHPRNGQGASARHRTPVHALRWRLALGLRASTGSCPVLPQHRGPRKAGARHTGLAPMPPGCRGEGLPRGSRSLSSPLEPLPLPRQRRFPQGIAMCQHAPACPSADAPDHEAAVLVAEYPDQGWALRCNGVLTFDDTGELLPDGTIIAPRRAAAMASAAA